MNILVHAFQIHPQMALRILFLGIMLFKYPRNIIIYVMDLKKMPKDDKVKE